MRAKTGTALVMAGVLLLVLTLGVSAAMAPDRARTATATNETLVGTQGLNSPGEVGLLNGSTPVWNYSDAQSYFEVEWLPDGRVLTAFVDTGYQDCGEFEAPCPRTGYRIIDPEPSPHVVEEWSFPIRSKKDSEVHAVEPLPTGGIALADMEHERIVIVDDEDIVWQWNASTFYDAPADPTRVDWLHINDVDAIGGGKLLVSVRNANQLLVLERGAGVVEVINEDKVGDPDESCRRSGELADYDGDGEVRCGNPALFLHQHNPHWLADGAILIADSENDRVVEIHRTEAGNWRGVWQLSSAGGIDLYWPRDADRLPNGNMLITDSLNKRVLEVNETGGIEWSTITPRVPYEADRLPTGEMEGVPQATTNGSIEGSHTRGGSIPVLSKIVLLLHTVIPAIPFWVGEVQIGIGILSFALIGLGVAVRYRS